MKRMSVLSVCFTALVAFAAWAPDAGAYPTYRSLNVEPPLENCAECHLGFIGGFGAPLHDAHNGYTNGCEYCHDTGPGSVPVLTGSSNNGALAGCTGCHQADGLQEHHINNPLVPVDGNGLTCAGQETTGCHLTRNPLPENLPPPYYGTPATSIEDPCSSAPPPGEDGALDGGGLDNDGDLLYDEADPDCVAECSVDADCDNGLFCDGAETCDQDTFTCQPGTRPSCDDGVGCTEDICDPDLDACVYVPNDGLCDDGNVCSGEETCDPLNDCQPGTPLDCDDGDLCTDDGCDAVAGCVSTPVECPEGEQCDPADGQCKAPPECVVDGDCNDGQFCNGVETCDTATGTCLPGTAVDCDDGVNCTVDICDETEDACVSTPDDTVCDDGDVCSGSETCDPVNDCQPGTPLDCDDLDLCTTDSCDAVAGCINTPVVCPEGQQCDPADGSCVQPPECEVDADCDDGQFCNGGETCDAATGTCLDGTPPDCDDGIECTVDTCDEVNDACNSTPDDSFCPDDGLFCTGEQICAPELCAGDESCDLTIGCISTGDPCPTGYTCNEDTDSCDMATGKVTICHIPPGNPNKAKSLTIGADGLEEHLAHGDTIGPCQ